CLCLALRPRPNRQSLATHTVSSLLPPRFPRRRLQHLMNFGARSRGFSTRCLRFTNSVATIHARLASGWLARLYRERVELSGSLQKVSDHPPPLLGLAWRKGSFMMAAPAGPSLSGGDEHIGEFLRPVHHHVVAAGAKLLKRRRLPPGGKNVHALWHLPTTQCELLLECC